jgi:hypothetical protein
MHGVLLQPMPCLLLPPGLRSTTGRGLVTAHHFFKVGQQRAQAKTMLLSLASQLAERLPGMAAELLPVIKEHGVASSLSMQDTFEK